jgi:type IX secretion system PorP/SprF family membrane protein
MAMKHYILSAIALLILNQAQAQQLPLYNQYYAVPFIQNPSLTGIEEDANLSLIHRSSWTDIPGAPTTSVLALDGPIKVKNIGLGGVIFNDVTDITQRTGFSSAYSYKLKINDDNHIYFGLSMGVFNNRIDFSRAIVNDIDDPFLMQNNRNKAVFDAGFGLTYEWTKLQIGLGANQLIGNQIKYTQLESNSTYTLARQFYGSAKYVFTIVKDKDITVYPLAVVRYTAKTPLQYDINAVLDWKKYGWFGVTYRSNYALGINLGGRISTSLRAGYCYELAVGKIKSYSGGTHEIMLGFTFGKKNDVPIVVDTQKEKEQMKMDMVVDSMIRKLKNENQTNKKEIDDLKQQVDELKKKTEEMKNAPVNNNTPANNNPTNNGTGEPKKEASITPNLNDSTGAMRMSSATDFTDEEGKFVIPSYYVIVGAFKSKEGAGEKKKQYLQRGFNFTQLFYNEKKKLYYVAVIGTTNEDAAKKELDDAKYGTPDAWVFVLK